MSYLDIQSAKMSLHIGRKILEEFRKHVEKHGTLEDKAEVKRIFEEAEKDGARDDKMFT